MPAEVRRKPLSPTLVWLSIGFCFMFAGASHQQFQSPFWDQALHWSPVKRSLIPATLYLTFGFWRLQISWFVARWGERRVLLLGSLSYGLYCLVVYFTTSFPVLLLAAALWGWGAAANWGTSTVMVLDSTKDERYGSSTGIFMAASSVGFCGGVLFFTWLFEQAKVTAGPLAARVVWLWAAGMIFAGVAVLLQVPDRRAPIDPPSLRAQWEIMSSPKGRIGSLFLFLGGFGFGAMLGVLADHLAGAFASGNKMYIVAFYQLAGIVANLVGGPASDRIGRPRALMIVLSLSALGLFVAGARPQSIWALIGCVTVLGFQSQLLPTLTMAMIGDSTHSSRRQNAYGALFLWRDLGVAGALLLTQYLHQLKDISAALFVMAGLTVLCAVSCRSLARRAEERL